VFVFAISHIKVKAGLSVVEVIPLILIPFVFNHPVESSVELL
jgi:hypothetical protein